MAKKERKPKSKAAKIVEYILLGVFGALFCFVLAGNISSMVHKKENYGQPIRFGMGTFQIRTSSMEPEIGKGTVVISMKEDVTQFEDRLKNNQKVDIVFANIDVDVDVDYDNPLYTRGTRVVTNEVMVHRLQEVHINEDVELGKGRYIFVAAGINTLGEHSREEQHQVFTEVQYLGTVKVVSSFLGGFTKVMSSPIGLIILLLIPAGYLIVTSSMDIFKALKEEEGVEVDQKSAANGDHLSSLSDADRQRLKNELLEEMINAKKESKKNDWRKAPFN